MTIGVTLVIRLVAQYPSWQSLLLHPLLNDVIDLVRVVLLHPVAALIQYMYLNIWYCCLYT
jgi:hypothetical protein